MATPIDPEMCITTGRLLTEWFEYPELTDEQEVELARKEAGVPEDMELGIWSNCEKDPERTRLQRKVNGFVNSRRKRKWRNNMTQQEVAMRMNEATKMINPDNYKFLPDDVRERTGLEVNPLWMMEALVRSGLLSPKEQVSALQQLAQYTHSKAPSISHSTTTQMNPEDWLLELAKDEYKEIEIEQPMQPVERGAGVRYESNMAKKVKETRLVEAHGDSELQAMMEEVDAEWEDLELDE